MVREITGCLGADTIAQFSNTLRVADMRSKLAQQTAASNRGYA